MGKYANAVLKSPVDIKRHTVERERQHKAREMKKTLFGLYNNGTGDIPFMDAKNLLKAIINHIKQDHLDLSTRQVIVTL